MVRDERMVRLGRAIEGLRTRRNLDKSELARRAGVTPSYILRLERGEYKKPSAETLEGVAGALGMTMAELWALAGESPPTPRAQIYMGVVHVPIVQRRVYAGGSDSWQETGEMVELGSEFATPNRDLLAGRVTGTCMSPHAEPGDVVIWDRATDRWVDGQMVVVTVETELLIKWAYRLADGSVVLTAPDGTMIKPNGAILEGPVIKIQRDPVRGPRLVEL